LRRHVPIGMTIYRWNAINSILAIRTYINPSIILLPPILLSRLSFTLFRTFESLCKRISSCARAGWTWRVGITFTGWIKCPAISFPVALFNSTNNILELCPSFNLKWFERQQIIKICRYMGSFIICPCVFNPIYSLWNSCCSRVHLNSDVIMDGSFGPPCLSMKSVNASQGLKSILEAGSCFWDRTILLPFDPRRITTMKVVFCDSHLQNVF